MTQYWVRWANSLPWNKSAPHVYKIVTTICAFIEGVVAPLFLETAPCLSSKISSYCLIASAGKELPFPAWHPGELLPITVAVLSYTDQLDALGEG